LTLHSSLFTPHSSFSLCPFHFSIFTFDFSFFTFPSFSESIDVSLSIFNPKSVRISIFHKLFFSFKLQISFRKQRHEKWHNINYIITISHSSNKMKYNPI
jgi:hypothetical protein